ncbi:alkaline phosphatase [uncultured Desulfosarcina sp.]|uniref:alkaline phosphatase n=1 Tax=uncultured Desulfosarcina sp. TaxID=218289 RepID=UPI0029C92CAE|nr:alkaline phosphatase [uncultured Desulfosarcina sp.]
MNVAKFVRKGRFVLIGALACTLCVSVAFAGSVAKGNNGHGYSYGKFHHGKSHHGNTHSGNLPKYVFYFIGDGMANVQVHAAEAYLAALVEDDATAGSEKAQLLNMSLFPVQGMSTTFADNRLITDSAAAGTALACGQKTTVGVISQTPDGNSIATLAEKAKARGMKVGILTSVTINHATPAVFYSHNTSRNNYQEIAEDLVNSNFDFFGGGFWNKEANISVEEAAVENGFTITTNLSDLEAVENGARVIAFDAAQGDTLEGTHVGALRYEMDRGYVNGMSLADFTENAIRILDNKNGFFMMVEGGKIDWACHANDARAAIDDTIAFDDAIAKAVAFYNQHPNETLIVVTGDHECGGMTIGWAGTAYDTFFEILQKQTMSFEFFNNTVLSTYMAGDEVLPEDIDTAMWQIIYDNFGLDGAGLSSNTDDDLTDYQISQLEDAFDRTVAGTAITGSEEDGLLYGGYEALTVTLTHVLNNRAGIDFTSYSHTGVPVMVLAKGENSELFDGFYDNTDVALKIAQAMGVNLD